MSVVKNKLKSRIFLDGAARRKDLLDILSKDRKLQEKDVSHTSIIAVYKGKWGGVKDVRWDATAIAIADKPEKRLVVIGEDGQYFTYIKSKSPEGKISPAPRLIRRAKTIDGYVYVCGVGRQVYQRTDTDNWTQMHASIPKKGERVGFEDIDGYSKDEIYCCGWNGEIWHFDGSDWFNRSGITNLILTSICCAGDGIVYIVGQQGLIIKGSRDAWEVVEIEEEFTTDFWDVHWFNGKLYVTTMTGLYTLQDNILDEVEFNDVLNTTFYRLSSAEGVLWSIGSSDVLSFDGKKWERYT